MREPRDAARAGAAERPGAAPRVAIWDAQQDVRNAALTRGMLAVMIAEDEGIAAARPVFVKALEGLEATIGKDQVNYLQTESNFASYLIGADRCDEAAPLLAHATTVTEKVLPRQLPMMLEAAARCDLAAHRAGDAIEKLERARAICADKGCPSPIPEGLAWQLGKSLVESRRDRARGLALVAEAEKVATEHQVGDLLDKIAAWRKKH